MPRKKQQHVRDADAVIRDYYEGDTQGSFRDDKTEPVSEVHNSRNESASHAPELSGGDMDAAWDQADVGTETVGGSNPTPDQDIVEDVGRAVGVTYQDDEPLKFGEKVPQRDERRWELDPASSEDYDIRASDTHPASPPSREHARSQREQTGKARSKKSRSRRS
ncbi:MAG TPA: DUF6335 family protein [Nitrospira sp.]|nr:DUF6335 family protein [Nitrospira sp.]